MPETENSLNRNSSKQKNIRRDKCPEIKMIQPAAKSTQNHRMVQGF
jgi:hypothetical protein